MAGFRLHVALVAQQHQRADGRRRMDRGGGVHLVLDHLRDGVGAIRELVVLADLGGPLDAEALQAGQLEALRQLLVVLLRGALQHRAHVARVVLAQLQRVRDGQLGIDDAPRVSDSSTPKRWSALPGPCADSTLRFLDRISARAMRQSLSALVRAMACSDRACSAAICDCRYCQIDVATRPATPMTKLDRKLYRSG